MSFSVKSIYTMLEDIRKLTGGRFVRRYERGQGCEGKLVPHVFKRLMHIEMDNRNYNNLMYARREFDVLKGQINFIIILRDKFYDGKKWLKTGIPCKHD